MTQEFKIKQGSLEIIKKQTFRFLAIAVITAIVFEFIFYLIFSNHNPPDLRGVKKSSLVLLPAFIILIYVNVKNLKTIKIIFDSYKLSFSNDSIIREQNTTVKLSIDYDNIEKITKDKNGYFSIKGRNKKDAIHISKYIENYTEVEALLNKIKIITKI